MSELKRDRSTAESHAANLLLLTWNAGMLDGLSYLHAHVFTANMTGNVVLLGLHLAERDLPDAWRSLLALGAFAAGCILAGMFLLKREEADQSAIVPGLSLELIFLGVFGLLFFRERSGGGYWIHAAFLSTAAMALAVQSVTVRRLRVAGVVTTFVTGTITTSMVGLARALRKQRPREWETETEHSLLLIGILGTYLAAAIFASVLDSFAPIVPALAPAAIVLIVIWRSQNSPQKTWGLRE